MSDAHPATIRRLKRAAVTSQMIADMTERGQSRHHVAHQLQTFACATGSALRKR